MRILAIIPARAGSKRLPRKNILTLGGKPLISWSIDIAKKVSEICDILITTDDQDVIDLCKKYHNLKICRRPPELATDDAATIDVLEHAIDFYNNINSGAIDGVLLLQPTSPLRSIESIHEAIRLFTKNKFHSIVSVSKVQENPKWMYKFADGRLLPFFECEELDKQQKHLDSIYILNGSIYLFPPSQLNKKTLISADSIPLVIESFKESLDIDTKLDFELAEFFLLRAN